MHLFASSTVKKPIDQTLHSDLMSDIEKAQWYYPSTLKIE